MLYPVEIESRTLSPADTRSRALDRIGALLAPVARVCAISDSALAGLRIGFVGEAASPGLRSLVRAMGATVETTVPDGRRLPAHRRPDAVVVSWPSTSGDEVAEWQQVARMKLDNPRLVVILLDWSDGSLVLPCHDLCIPRGAATATIRAILADLRLLRREQVLAAEGSAPATVAPLFRRPAKAAAAAAPLRELPRAA